jgi:hypothetical protein
MSQHADAVAAHDARFTAKRTGAVARLLIEG